MLQAKAHDQPALHARAATVQALRSSLLNLCDCLTKEAQAVEDARDAATDLKHVSARAGRGAVGERAPAAQALAVCLVPLATHDSGGHFVLQHAQLQH